MKVSLRLAILFLCFFVISDTIAQLSLSAGAEYRITPIDVRTKKDPQPRVFLVPQNRDEFLSGFGLKFVLDAKLTDRFSLSTATIFRYDNMHHEIRIDTIFNRAINKNIHNLFIDYSFMINYKVILKEEKYLKIGLGYSFMGRESEFTITQIVMTPSGPEYHISDRHYHYAAYVLGLEYAFDRNYSLGLTMYYIYDHPFFVGASNLILPALNFQYHFNKRESIVQN